MYSKSQYHGLLPPCVASTDQSRKQTEAREEPQQQEVQKSRSLKISDPNDWIKSKPKSPYKYHIKINPPHSGIPKKTAAEHISNPDFESRAVFRNHL